MFVNNISWRRLTPVPVDAAAVSARAGIRAAYAPRALIIIALRVTPTGEGRYCRYIHHRHRRVTVFFRFCFLYPNTRIAGYQPTTSGLLTYGFVKITVGQRSFFIEKNNNVRNSDRGGCTDLVYEQILRGSALALRRSLLYIALDYRKSLLCSPITRSSDRPIGPRPTPDGNLLSVHKLFSPGRLKQQQKKKTFGRGR